jgi:hypothetical protein
MKFIIPVLAVLTLAAANPVVKPESTPTPKPRSCTRICMPERFECGEGSESVSIGVSISLARCRMKSGWRWGMGVGKDVG